MISLTEAFTIIARQVPFFGKTEEVPLKAALGHILGANVFSDVSLPSFDRSAMDGFAVRAQDVASAPRELRITGESVAGKPWKGKLAAGCAVRIMTGAKVPAGANAVVMVEHTRPGSAEDRIEILQGVPAGKNLSHAGEELHRGDKVLEKGTRLREQEIGILATVGKAKVPVFVPPEVAVLPTGTELIPVDRYPKDGQIRDSNAPALAALVNSAGGRPKVLAPAKDDPKELKRKVQTGLRSPVLVSSGGVSAGKYDLVEDVLRACGVEILFDQVAIRPGKPAVFGRKGNTLVFGLPGNPVSSFLAFELFVRKALALLIGFGWPAEPNLHAILEDGEVRGAANFEVFRPATVDVREGTPYVRPVVYHGSQDLMGLTRANGFVRMKPGAPAARAGEVVTVRLLHGAFHHAAAAPGGRA